MRNSRQFSAEWAASRVAAALALEATRNGMLGLAWRGMMPLIVEGLDPDNRREIARWLWPLRINLREEGPSMFPVTDPTAVPLWRAAELLSLDVEDVFDLLISGERTAMKKPNGRPLIPMDQVDRLRERRAVGPQR